ncbi:tail tape measure protein [Nitratireductor pacificus]|uniref:Tail tape measure protein TP901 core region n=1 Tax=Nitratireductor pacificus pht-3B TaxID=391937 RepID=K2MYL9_9HYPH|nr:tail tape measure protein [Nitratireductor pacificus]EKF17063.1 tail tape measure protein TP901 core region [Nitratireductor pacificus pht-3B]
MANEDLRYRIGGDTSGIDAAWGKIRRDAQSTGSAIGGAMGKARSGVESIMAPLRAVPALFAAIGATAVIGKVRQTAESVAEVGRQAKQAGVDVEAFQELKFVAEQNRIGVDILTDGLKELNLRADEFVATGRGSGAEAFGRLGYSSEELARKLKNPSALFTEIIGKLEQFDQAARIRISDELFGGSAGERFVELIDRGEKGIREQIAAARDLGLVMDSDMIRKAEEVDRQFSVITTTIGTSMKRAIIGATSAWFEFLNSYRSFESQQSSALENSAREDGRQRLEIEKQIFELKERQSSLVGKAFELQRQEIDSTIGRLNASLSLLSERDRQREGVLAGRDRPQADSEATVKIDTSVEFIRKYNEQLALSNRERAIAAETQRILNDASSQGASLTEEQARKLAELSVARKEADSTSQGSAKAADREAEAIGRVIAGLEFELSQMGKTDLQKRISNELRNAGADAASREGQRIAELVTRIEAQRAAEESLKAAQEARTQSLEYLFQAGQDAFLAMIDNSGRAEDAVKRLAIQLAFAAAQAALLGTGPLAGLFGGTGGFQMFPGGFGLPTQGVGLFDVGGWTGDGNPSDVAGLTHQREFVVKAGPAEKYRPLLEAINMGHGIGMFSMPQRMAESAREGSGLVTLRVIGEEGPMFRPTIRAESENVAVQVSQQAIGRFDARLPDRVQEISNDPRARG